MQKRSQEKAPTWQTLADVKREMAVSIPATKLDWSQWSGNGHWYAYVPEKLTWTNARQSAFGLDGDLATPSSAGENAFVTQLIKSKGATLSAWLGGYQTPGSPEPSAEWRWVSGEPFTYTAWNPGGAERARRRGLPPVQVFRLERRLRK